MGTDDKSSTDAPEAVAEFKAAAEAMSTGMNDVVASALRLQMLMIEDAQNMMAELSAVCAAAADVMHETKENALSGRVSDE